MVFSNAILKTVGTPVQPRLRHLHLFHNVIPKQFYPAKWLKPTFTTHVLSYDTNQATTAPLQTLSNSLFRTLPPDSILYSRTRSIIK